MEFDDYRRMYESLDKYKDEMFDEVSRTRLTREMLEWKRPNLEAVAPRAGAWASIAEIGCFTGELIAGIFAGHQLDRVGFDVNSVAIAEAARRHGAHCTFVCGDLLVDGRRFDVIVLSDIVEHIDDDETFLRRSAEHADLLLLNLPLEKCWATRRRRYGPDDSSGHLRAYGISDAERLIDRAGLRIVASHVRWYCESDLGRELSGGSTRVRSVVKAALLAVPAVRRRYFPSNLFAALTTA